MKIFQDWKASKTFTDAYNGMKLLDREVLAEKARNLADKKINSEEGEYKEFYLTVKDIKELIRTVRPFPL